MSIYEIRDTFETARMAAMRSQTGMEINGKDQSSPAQQIVCRKTHSESQISIEND